MYLGKIRGNSMRIAAAFIFVFFIAGSSSADPTPTPEPTPTPTASPYSSLPKSVVETMNITKYPTLLLQASVGRESLAIGLLSGVGVKCSQTDSEVRSDIFQVVTGAEYNVVDPSGAVYCKTSDYAKVLTSYYATVEITSLQNPDRGYTKVVKNIGTVSIRVLPRNQKRSRAIIQQSGGSDIVHCGYECPATTSNATPLQDTVGSIFRGNNPICCVSQTGLNNIAIICEDTQQ